MVRRNPFRDLVAAVGANKARQVLVNADVVEQIIISAPVGDWRTIFALSRYAGLRVPSELAELRWRDVCWSTGRLLIHSPKTAHHVDGGDRSMPILPELRKHLWDAYERRPDDAEFVINRPELRSMKTSLTTRGAAVVKQAGYKPWPKLFQNMRSTLETELIGKYPIGDVVSWIGNSKPVAYEALRSGAKPQF